MPELAAIYALGLITCMIATAVFLWLSLRRRGSRAARTLNSNLRRIGLFWSDHKDRIEPWSEGIEEKEKQDAMRSVLLLGAFCSALSWPGLFFLLIIMVSIRFLARSRLEKRLFSSRLAQVEDLPPLEVKELADQARAIAGHTL